MEWSRVSVHGGVKLKSGPSDSDHHLVGQVQQLQSEKRAVARQVGSSVEITQEVSALASVGPLKRCGVQLR